MFDIDKWHEIFSSLAKNPLRTTLTALGVFWGIFMLVIILGAGNGLYNGAERGFDGRAKNSLFLWSQRTSKPYMGLPAGRYFRMNNGDFEALKSQINEADVIAPRNQFGGFGRVTTVSRGSESGSYDVLGDYPEIAKVEAFVMEEGRFINPFDMADKRKVAVIGLRIKELFFRKGEEVIGQNLNINGVYFKVVGVFRTKEPGERGIRNTARIHVPFTTFQQAFNYGDNIGWFTMTAKAGKKSSLVAEKAIDILKIRHKIHPLDQRAFGQFNLEEDYEKLQSLFKGIFGISWFVGVMTLIAGVIGVSNIMLVIVKERTREIGVRRALGAKPWDVMSQIIIESIFLTSVAGFLGMVCGILILDLISILIPPGDDSMFADPFVKLNTALISLGIMIISGAMAGIIPARKAVSISPVDALRTE
ncbi:MAG: ABC transporter permease [Bacteroidota bacterium]